MPDRPRGWSVMVPAAVAVATVVAAGALASVYVGRTGMFKDKGGRVAREVRSIPPVVTPPGAGSLQLTMTAPSGTTWLGQCVTVTLHARNTGGSRLTGVKAHLATDDGGTVVAAMSGPVPAGPVQIVPDATVSFVWTCTMSGIGVVCFTGAVTGLDSLNEQPFAGYVLAVTTTKVPGTLEALLTASGTPPIVGDIFDIALSVSNNGGTDIEGAAGHLTVTAGAGFLVTMAGPVPAGPVTVPAGGFQAFVWTFSATGIGYVAVTASATGTVAGLATQVTAIGSTEFTSYGGISTIAGPSGLQLPAGVAVDASGNVYVAEYAGHCVSKIEAGTGTVTTVAGVRGNLGYNGDGVATARNLCCPADVAIGPDGNLYIADECDNLIRKVDLSAGPPTMSTVAGIPGAGGYNGDSMTPTSAWLYYPRALAFDNSGNLFVADTFNNRVRFFNIYGGNISTFAGGGGSGPSNDPQPQAGASLQRPQGVAWDPASGAIYIADTLNNRVRAVSGGLIWTVAGTGGAGSGGDGGPAGSAMLNNPYGVDLDAAGNLYIADYNNHKVRRVAGGTITTVAGTGTLGYNGDGLLGPAAQLNYPWGVGVDSTGAVYIGDEYNNRVRLLYP